MAQLGRQTQSVVQTVDLRISIPELPAVGTFWMRNYPTHRNFGELYQDCVNHADVTRERKTLEQVRASRHFWFDEVMLRRDVLLDTLLTQNAGREGIYEFSLTLQRDYYRIYPANLLKTKSEHNYIDAEKPVKEILEEIMIADECPSCFDLCSHRKRRISPGRSLADERLWPAWKDGPADEFPARASLLLRPRITWLPYMLYVVALGIGLLAGYYLIKAVMPR